MTKKVVKKKPTSIEKLQAKPPPNWPPPFEGEHTPMRQLARLIQGALHISLEVHAPIPQGLTDGMRKKLLQHRSEAELSLARRIGEIAGYTSAAASAGLITHDDFRATAEATRAIADGSLLKKGESDAAVGPKGAAKVDDGGDGAPRR